MRSYRNWINGEMLSAIHLYRTDLVPMVLNRIIIINNYYHLSSILVVVY